MIGGSVKEYYCKIVDQSAGNNRFNKKGGSTVCAIVQDSVPATVVIRSRARGEARNRVMGARQYTDYPTPPTSLVFFFCTVIFNSRKRNRADNALSAEFIPGEPPRPGQEASSNPILALNDRRQRKEFYRKKAQIGRRHCLKRLAELQKLERMLHLCDVPSPWTKLYDTKTDEPFDFFS